MNIKRLDHDKWGFQGFPYYEMRIDTKEFHGMSALIDLNDGDYYYWDMPLAGKVPVCGGGMVWLELIPDNSKHVITVKYRAPNENGERNVSVWYVDIIEDITCADDGTHAFVDKYLDVVFTPEGDVIIDDRDQLDDAYNTGDITKEQYEAAIVEGDKIIAELCVDIKSTEQKCARLLKYAFELISEGKTTLARNTPKKVIFLDIDGVLDTFNGGYYQELKPGAVKYLNDIVSATGAKIVVISTWKTGSDIYSERYGIHQKYQCERDNWKNLMKLFEQYGLEVFDITPSSEELTSREAEIRQFLSTRRDVESFVILDDCFQNDYLSDKELHDRLVFVNCGPSLQECDAENAIKILNRKYVKSKS